MKKIILAVIIIIMAITAVSCCSAPPSDVDNTSSSIETSNTTSVSLNIEAIKGLAFCVAAMIVVINVLLLLDRKSGTGSGFNIEDIKSLQKDHEKLSAEHDKMQNHISESIKQERELLEKDTDRIISQNDFQLNLLNALYSESKKRDLQFDNLIVEQRDAYQQMQKFSFLLSEVSRLQTENSELRKESIRLENENKKLNARKYSHKK